MWIILYVVTLVWLTETQADDNCEDVIHQCYKNVTIWTKCYEDRIATCNQRRRMSSTFTRLKVNSHEEAVARLPDYRVHIPSSALQRSRGAVADEEVLVVASVINSTYFQLSPPLTHRPGTIMMESVLAVKAGNFHVTNLSQSITVAFKRNNTQEEHGTCVFWQDSEQNDGTGHWSTDGCDTNKSGTEFICSCNHLSFFAVLVNPVLTVEKIHADVLNYITYIGSAISVCFTIISLIIFTCLQRRRPEKAIVVHMQLAGALLCLHFSFLLCSLWTWLLKENEEGLFCQVLGLLLHWSLLATFSWMALEGFHLYLLLVRVFNIYIRRYLLKVCVVGWGLPTLTVAVCGILSVYGKYNLEIKGENSTAQICWMSSQLPQRLLVSYITTVAFPGLVILCNFCMLGLVVFKLWHPRRGIGGDSRGGWKKMDKEKGSMLWKNGVTLLGLGCVLGLPWGLATTTYISLPGIYVFTILNSLQGLFIFLWSMALSCKSRSDNNSSSREPSSQKVMTTSFNT